jgi:Protein of unknown function (DUF4012)
MPAAHAHRWRRQEERRRGFYRRWWFWAAFVLLAAVVAVGAWVGGRALQAKSELEAAQGLVGTLKNEALKQDSSGAAATLKLLTAHSSKARALTNDPIWRACESLPFIGPNLTAVRQMANVTDSVMSRAVAPLLKLESTTLNPADIAPKGGAIDTSALSDAVGPVQKANTAIHGALTSVKAIDTSATLEPVQAAKTKLLRLLNSVAPLSQTLSDVLPLLAPALGADAPRKYLVIFENNAEARPLGGTDLSNALITIDKGRIQLTQTAPSTGFTHYAGAPVVPVPDGVQQLYRGIYGTFIADSTQRPDFPSAAQIAQQMWQRQFGGQIDGVISIDPVALSYMYRALNPLTLSTGDLINSNTLVPFLLNTVYQRYWTKNATNSETKADNNAQDAVYSATVEGTFAQLAAGKFKPTILVKALEQAVNEHRLLLWSGNAKEQAQIVKAGINGALPASDKTTDRVGVYVSDGIGSKMDYYLTQSVTLSHAVCRADGRANYRVSISLTNTAPANAAVALSPSILGESKRQKLLLGYQRMFVYLYAPPGSTITGASSNGDPAPITNDHDTTYPVEQVDVQFAPGAVQTVTFDVVAPKPGNKKLAADVTPMVHPTKMLTAPLDCSTVPKS